MMVWMITIVGSTFMIPDTVMGLTFIAAGVSVPDALAGIAVVREGNIYIQDNDLDKSSIISRNLLSRVIDIKISTKKCCLIYRPQRQFEPAEIGNLMLQLMRAMFA